MAGQCSRISLVMLMIILISQLSSCSVARRCPGEAIKQTHRSNSLHFFAKTQEEASRDEVRPIYGVSLRDVPGGPNPLHN